MTLYELLAKQSGKPLALVKHYYDKTVIESKIDFSKAGTGERSSLLDTIKAKLGIAEKKSNVVAFLKSSKSISDYLKSMTEDDAVTTQSLQNLDRPNAPLRHNPKAITSASEDNSVSSEDEELLGLT